MEFKLFTCHILNSARALGERCGGRHNVVGVCGAGLRCFGEFKDAADNNILKTRDAENVAVGVCVDEDFEKCPKASVESLTMVNCRPGVLGILVKFLNPTDFLTCKKKIHTIIHVDLVLKLAANGCK